MGFSNTHPRFTNCLFAIRMVPGDPLTLFVSRTQESGFSFTKAQLDALRRRFGLDKPVIVQYVDWISNMLRGDLGSRFITGRMSPN